ncbi:predicted protein [Naegleria gruberi]|uniref:Predicted protein n=1 Tax=Naegleria gruberi TaxID=5762 RepID=D2W6E9_NAEGR|nr:uncharacterized protein NAEGRDRAFT_54958 [Naegleria gruberi]EFC35353.1 predicted protein [Naegleria gruberi]|eukprot:XP_002668097.1 predicted protein [Naegleria gruberi strain NEG-M]
MSQHQSSHSSLLLNFDQTTTSISHCYSGGCEGTDFEWTKAFGKKSVVYSFAGHHQRVLPNVGEQVITLDKKELAFADKKLSEANKYLKRRNTKFNLLRRNYYIISKAASCYAIIEEFENKTASNKSSVRIRGGTAWGCQMFLLKYISENQIQDKKNVQPHLYAFCQEAGNCKWFGISMDVKGGEIVNTDWSEMNPKKLSGKFAGIGVRAINDSGNKPFKGWLRKLLL